MSQLILIKSFKYLSRLVGLSGRKIESAAPVDYYSFFVQRAAMAPDIPEVDAYRRPDPGLPACVRWSGIVQHGNLISMRRYA